MPKNLVVCNDGTGNKFGDHNTNVVKAFALLRQDDPASLQKDHSPKEPEKGESKGQLTFYDPGIGTFSAFGYSPIKLRRGLGRALGQAFGYGLRQNLSDALSFLMRYHEAGDRIYLIGFSRGAFTVRKLADIVATIGIPREGCQNLIPYVIELYNDYKRGKIDASIINGFQETYCKKTEIECVAVFDTVASLGWLLGRRFKNSQLHQNVKAAIHAVAIDEQRAKFPPALWQHPNNSDSGSGQIIKQVWFAGVHADVGGWYNQQGLSDNALKWLLAEAQQHGLMMDDEQGWSANLNSDPLGKLHESRQGFWRLWAPAPRTISSGAWIHESVYRRCESDATYNPSLPDDAVPISTTLA